MKEFQQAPPKGNEETNDLLQSPSRVPSQWFDMLTGQMNPMKRQHEQMTSTDHQPKRETRPLLLEDPEDEPDQFTN